MELRLGIDPIAERLGLSFTALGIDPAYSLDGFRAAHPFPVAVRLAMLGFRVMPTRVETKIPCVKGWPERATTDPTRLARWQSQFNPNWSILTGRENGVIVLDIDGEQGRADLARLETELGALPLTWRCNSGRVNGGFHIWLRPPPGNDDLRNQQPLPGYKVDVRGFHGHVVVAGSLHKSGNRYAWAPGCSPDEIALAECPPEWWAWLPKKDEAVAAPLSKSTPSARQSSPVKRTRDPASYLFGDDPGYGGFQDPISKNAIRYFLKAGDEAPAEPIISGLQRMIVAAPKDHGRDVSRYLHGPDLPRLVERARLFVKENVSEES
jgi:hypothetical protein